MVHLLFKLLLTVDVNDSFIYIRKILFNMAYKDSKPVKEKQTIYFKCPD